MAYPLIASDGGISMNKTLFGVLESGKEIYKITLRSGTSSAEVISLGASITSFKPFGREIVAGFNELSAYLGFAGVYGATVGRVCNRIVGAKFEMDGVTYDLTKNNGENCLHGGSDAFHTKAWDVLEYGEDYALFGYMAPDGQSGFPGNIDVKARYTLADSELRIEYTATPDRRTPIMMTSHSFFNLESHTTDVLAHKIKIYADKYTEINELRLPTGNRPDVADTPYDFRTPRAIGECIGDSALGYDHNFILRGDVTREIGGKSLALAAEVWGKELKLSAYTDQPGIQLYVTSGAPKSRRETSSGAVLGAFASFCLEPQIEPNCIKDGRCFVDGGETYECNIVYRADRQE